MNDWLSNLPRKRLLVVGDLMVDCYVWGAVERISPEAPVLILQHQRQDNRPGGAANVASFITGLDADVLLAGVVGDDSEATTLRQLLCELRIEQSMVYTDAMRPTTTKQRFVGSSAQRQPHQLLRVDRESRSPIPDVLERLLIDRISLALPSCDAVVISDYAKGVCTPLLLRSVIQAARSQGIPVIIDPCRGVDYRQYAGATVLCPNRSAAELAIKSFSWPPSHSFNDHPTILNAAKRLQHELELTAAIITLDRDGLAYATATDARLVPCRTRHVCDVTGAGDMVIAVLGLGFAAGVSLEEGLAMANAAAGLEVERFGVERLTRHEISSELARNAPDLNLVSTLETLRIHVADARRRGLRIVFTNGCFDLLHGGHLALLEEAAAQGELLIVAINSDVSVRKLKGTGRPIIDQENRARMLAALACVDHVVIFDDDTPERLLAAVRPDILVKGGTTEIIVGAEFVESYGGKVYRTGTVPGLSTTSLVDRMQRCRDEATT